MAYGSRANVQIRKILVGRGNTTISSNHTGVRGEITMDTDLKALRIHDGVQVGGYVMAGQGWVQQYVANASLGNVDLSTYGFATQSNLTALATYASANAATQANAISSLTANAAVQATALFVINNTLTNQNNAMGALSASIGDLYSNAATQSTAISNINSKMMVVGATTPTGVEGAEWFNTIDGRTYVYTANVWIDANPTIAPAPSFYLGNLTIDGDTINFTNGDLTIDSNGNLLVNGSLVQGGGGSNYGNANVAAYLPVYGGNVLAGNISSVTGTLGLSANAAAPGLAWTLTNNAFGAGSSALVAPASDDQHQGEIVFPSGNGMQLGAIAWAGNLGSPFDNSLLVTSLFGNVVVSTQGIGGGSYWQFGFDGNLQLPVANSSAVLGDTFGDGGITLQSPEAKYVELGAFDGNAYVWVADHGYYNDSGRINSAVYISTDYNDADHRWAFDPTGTTTVPGPVIVPAGNPAVGMNQGLIFSTNRGTTINGRLSVNNDNLMTAIAGSGFAVEIGGHPRFIANTTAVALDSASDMVFKSNTAFGGDHVMTFAASGDLIIPRKIVASGNVLQIGNSSNQYGSVQIDSYNSAWIFNGNIAEEYGYITIDSGYESGLVGMVAQNTEMSHRMLYSSGNLASTITSTRPDSPTPGTPPTVQISLYNDSSAPTATTWVFGGDGNLTVPGNITGTGQDVTITADTTDYVFYANGNLSMPAGGNLITSTGGLHSVSLDLLKSIVASSNSWAEFQANIAAL